MNLESPPVPALIGDYAPPSLKLGDRVYCRYRRAWCYVTGWGNGPIAWPRVQQIGVRGRPGLLVNRELECAIRLESVAALMHWFGVSPKPVSWWRRAFGVGGVAGTPGSRAVRRTNQLTRTNTNGASKIMRAAARVSNEPPERTDLARTNNSRIRIWLDEELALLGTDLDEVIAAKIGRTPMAVTWQRCKRGIPPVPRTSSTPRAWTRSEIAKLGTNTDEAVASAINRTVIAVTSKRIAMRIPPFVPDSPQANSRSRFTTRTATTKRPQKQT